MTGRINTAWKTTMLAKFNGDEKALSAYMSAKGAQGGRNGHTGGFHADRELARRAGKIGGTKSRRLKKVVL